MQDLQTGQLSLGSISRGNDGNPLGPGLQRSAADRQARREGNQREAKLTSAPNHQCFKFPRIERQALVAVFSYHDGVRVAETGEPRHVNAGFN